MSFTESNHRPFITREKTAMPPPKTLPILGTCLLLSILHPHVYLGSLKVPCQLLESSVHSLAPISSHCRQLYCVD